VLIFAWAVLSKLLARDNVTGPFVFALCGYLLANPDWGVLTLHVHTESVRVIAELALALLLFSDAARVNVHALRRDASTPSRLLGIGLPITIVAGGFAAAAVLVGLPWAVAGFVGAALAPTDAALSAQVIADERIPMRLRRVLNVESGLNDGIATPVVTVMIAAAASQLGVTDESASFEVGHALRELGGGLLLGLAVGIVGALVMHFAQQRDWIVDGGRQLAALALPIAAYTIAVSLSVNGFIAAFVAGIAWGAVTKRATRPSATVGQSAAPAEGDAELEHVLELPELGGELAALVVWFLFGAVLLPLAFAHLSARVVIYALLSLTVLRMVPVAISLLGAGFDGATVVFLGWFGPRGLASVVFALIAIEELGESRPMETAIATVTLTVAASVVLHGVTAGPGGRSYVEREAEAEAERVAPLRPRAVTMTRGRA
jgi:NhaP-type Na+/H+ or K+/H+ antiporter